MVIDIINRFFQMIIGLGNGGCTDGVRFDDIGSGFEGLRMKFFDDIRSREPQNVVVTF